MATTKRTSTPCPYCSWKTSKSYYIPHHIISNHYKEICCTSMSGHYLSCYGKNTDVSFLVCLTCHGGTLSDSSTKQGLEWITKHSKNTECKRSHSQKYQEFKINLTEAIPPPLTVDVHAPPSSPNISTTIESLWEQFKSNKSMYQYMITLEDQCDPVNYDDSDTESKPTFTALKGFEMAILYGMENKKDINRMKATINELEKEIETIKTEQYNQNIKYQQIVFNLQSSLRTEQKNIEEYKRNLSISDKELLRYRKYFPNLPEE